MPRGKPPWEPLTLDEGRRILATLKKAASDIGNCLDEMEKRDVKSIPMRISPLEKPLGHVAGFCASASAKVNRVDLERQLYEAATEEENQMIYRRRKESGDSVSAGKPLARKRTAKKKPGRPRKGT